MLCEMLSFGRCCQFANISHARCWCLNMYGVMYSLIWFLGCVLWFPLIVTGNGNPINSLIAITGAHLDFTEREGSCTFTIVLIHHHQKRGGICLLCLNASYAPVLFN